MKKVLFMLVGMAISYMPMQSMQNNFLQRNKYTIAGATVGLSTLAGLTVFTYKNPERIGSSLQTIQHLPSCFGNGINTIMQTLSDTPATFMQASQNIIEQYQMNGLGNALVQTLNTKFGTSMMLISSFYFAKGLVGPSICQKSKHLSPDKKVVKRVGNNQPTVQTDDVKIEASTKYMYLEDAQVSFTNGQIDCHFFVDETRKQVFCKDLRDNKIILVYISQQPIRRLFFVFDRSTTKWLLGVVKNDTISSIDTTLFTADGLLFKENEFLFEEESGLNGNLRLESQDYYFNFVNNCIVVYIKKSNMFVFLEGTRNIFLKPKQSEPLITNSIAVIDNKIFAINTHGDLIGFIYELYPMSNDIKIIQTTAVQEPNNIRSSHIYENWNGYCYCCILANGEKVTIPLKSSTKNLVLRRDDAGI